MKCPSCNKDILSNSKKCLYCGINIEMSNINKKYNSKNNKKKSIVLIETLILLSIVILYFVLYGEKIKENIDYAHEQNLIKSCEKDYEGTWNHDKKICVSAIGLIEIK